MQLTEALNLGNNKAKPVHLINFNPMANLYAYKDEEGIIRWIDDNTPVSPEAICNSWVPYELEICEACNEIEEIKKKYGPLLTIEVHRHVNHLYKYHCKCKGAL